MLVLHIYLALLTNIDIALMFQLLYFISALMRSVILI